jgi:hypothetical protein
MRLLIVYCVILAIGGFVCFLAGDITDKIDTTYGLLTFLALFFVNLWVSWRVAIRLTGPRSMFGGA